MTLNAKSHTEDDLKNKYNGNKANFCYLHKFLLVLKFNNIACQNLLDQGKSNRVPEKTSMSALLTMPKTLTVWITINCGKF